VRSRRLALVDRSLTRLTQKPILRSFVWAAFGPPFSFFVTLVYTLQRAMATGASGTAADAMSFFTLASGPGYGFSFASNSPPPAGFTTEQVFDNTLVLDASGNVIKWALELGTGPGGNFVASYNSSFVQDFADQNNINISISTTPGTWSCLTDNGGECGLSPAPGPIPGAGFLSYVALGLLGLGSAGWKRLRI
jgi:hypothetical protein